MLETFKRQKFQRKTTCLSSSKLQFLVFWSFRFSAFCFLSFFNNVRVERVFLQEPVNFDMSDIGFLVPCL